MMLLNPFRFGGDNPVWDGLFAYYTADDTTTDEIGGNDVTLVNGATYAAGIINNGFSFDGIDDSANIADNAFNFAGDFSISGWFNIDSVSGANALISNYTIDSGNYGWALLTLSSDLKMNMYGVITEAASRGGVSAGVNSFFAMTYNSTTEELKLTLNAGTTTVASVNNPIYTTTHRPTIGALRYSPTGTTWYFDGVIDEVAIFNVLKTPSEITEIYNAGAGIQYPN
jgi:hypothetical protein